MGLSFSGNAAKIKSQQMTISGTVNVNKDPNENGYIPPGRYVFASQPFTGPSGEMILIGSFPRIIIPGGALAWDLGNGFAAIMGVRDSAGVDHWTDLPQYSEKGAEAIISVVTAPEGTEFTGTFTTGNVRAAAVSDSTGTYKNDLVAELYLNLTFNVSNSSCLITTPHNAIFNWPGISPSEIRNGSVPVQTAPVTMSCSSSGAEEMITRPVAITFTSTDGSADAANGIIKTDKANLGLKLTWHSNGQPVQLDKVNEFPAVAAKTVDFSVDAQPVALNSPNTISGGSFATTVTMTVEYR